MWPGTCWSSRSSEPQLHPVVVDDPKTEPGQIAHGVKSHQRVVRAGLYAEVAADVTRVQILVGQGRQLRQQRGLRAARPKRSSKSEGRTRWSPSARQRANRWPRLCRAAGRPGWCRRPTSCPRVIRSAATRPVPEQRAQVAAAGIVEHVHSGEGQSILGRRHDARLVLAVEGVSAVGRCIRVGSRLRCPERSEPGGDRRSAHARPVPAKPSRRAAGDGSAAQRGRRSVATLRRPARHLRQRLGEGLDLGRERAALGVEHREYST